jgi:hypothetical protein
MSDPVNRDTTAMRKLLDREAVLDLVQVLTYSADTPELPA